MICLFLGQRGGLWRASTGEGGSNQSADGLRRAPRPRRICDNGEEAAGRPHAYVRAEARGVGRCRQGDGGRALRAQELAKQRGHECRRVGHFRRPCAMMLCR